MNDNTEAYHLSDYGECMSEYESSYQGERYRVNALSNSIERPKKSNEIAKVGSKCKCPICGNKFEKNYYQQKFCSIRCKNMYHNRRQRYY